VAEGQAAGVFAGPDPQRAAIELASLIDGLAVQIALDDSVVTSDVARRTCIEFAERLLEADLPSAEPEEALL
jgi:BetI-type transcriptional repressor, C-terminal